VTLGPLEYLVVGFTRGEIDGSVADEIARVVDSGIIRLVDVVFIYKDEAGEAAVLEIDNADDPRFAGFAPLLSGRVGLFTEEDVETLAAELPEGTAGLAILFEHRWAERIKDAMAAKGAFLVSRTVVPPEVLEELTDELEAAAAEAELPA
jgi:hypothetical protein